MFGRMITITLMNGWFKMNDIEIGKMYKNQHHESFLVCRMFFNGSENIFECYSYDIDDTFLENEESSKNWISSKCQ